MDDQTLQQIFEQITFFRLFLALLFLLLTWGAVTLLRFAADRLAGRFGQHRLLISSSYPVLRLGIWVGAVGFVLFVIFNPSMNAVITISASLGLAVGLGAQDLIRNLIAGVLLLVDRPFRVGDMIQVGEHYGEVTSVGLRSTRIQTFGDSTVSLPNSQLLGQAVSNSNSGALDEMVEIRFTLPAHLDLPLVKDLAWQAAACSPYAYLKKPVRVVVEDVFERTFLTRLKIKVYVLDVRYERLLASDVTERLKQVLVERGILTEQLVLGLSA